MRQSSSSRLSPFWSWADELAQVGLRGFAANHAVAKPIEGTSIGARYWIEGASARPSGCVRHRAIRRYDDLPVWLVIPEDPRAHRFSYAIPFLRAAKLAREVRHPYVLRTHEAGLLDDGRPYAVIERVPSESLANVLARHGALPWPEVLQIALRLASAVEAARERGLAPRDLDVDTCLHVRDGLDVADVRLGELFVASVSRPEEHDAPAIVEIVRTLVGGAAQGELAAALARDYASLGELAEALAAVPHDGTRESHGANHAAIAGGFVIDVEAEEAADAARPIPKCSLD
ncbi:MAG TPA: hypothetical protein VG755_09225 [Nannocystaceae bacterium]|nr:hypothetical protein [Nannocystaceae bacterium]